MAGSQPTPILFIDHAAAMGGAEHSLLTLLQHLDRSRWDIHAACSAGPLGDRLSGLGLHVHTLAFPRLRGFPGRVSPWGKEMRQLATLIRTQHIQAVYANTVRGAFYGAAASAKTGIPLIWHMRDFWLSETKPKYLLVDTLLKTWLSRKAAAVIANSHAVAAKLPHQEKITVIHNAVDPRHWQPVQDSRQAKTAFGIPASALVVGMAGRLRPWKGQETFLRSMALVAHQVEDAWFLLVGGDIFQTDPTYTGGLASLAQSLGIHDQVIMTGHLADPRTALAAMDLFVHPGAPEPFGLVNIEAMSMGKPVVGFRHGALPEIVVDGETGRLARPGNIQDMANQVVQLLQDETSRGVYGTAGRLRVENYFKPQMTAAQVNAVLESVVKL